MNRNRLLIISSLVALAALARLLPHPPNFVPVAALALFAGALVPDRRLAFLVPLVAMLISDLFLGFHAGMALIYVCMAITVAIGMQLTNRIRFTTVAGAAVVSSVLFFVITNFGVWLTSGMYGHNLSGLLACYVAAIPFYHYTLLGNAFYAAILFGGFALIERTSLTLGEAKTA